MRKRGGRGKNWGRKAAALLVAEEVVGIKRIVQREQQRTRTRTKSRPADPKGTERM